MSMYTTIPIDGSLDAFHQWSGYSDGYVAKWRLGGRRSDEHRSVAIGMPLTSFDFDAAKIQNITERYPDLHSFLDLLREHGHTSGLDTSSGDVKIARAPGRLDVMGGVSDYSGGLVLQLPIDKACFTAAQKHGDTFRITSHRLDQISSWECPVDKMERYVGYDTCQDLFKAAPWAGYIAGCMFVLKNEGYWNEKLPGMSLFLSSAVPEGRGISSSACIEVAAMKAIVAALGIKVEDLILAELCQIVENRVVGASCGIMDQMTAMMGEEGKFLKLLCQPSTIMGHLPLPENLVVVGFDSGERHSILGADYESVRVATFMGLKILRSHPEIRKPLPYLTHLTPEELALYEPSMPDVISGDDFLKEFGDHIDSATTVIGGRSYYLKPPVRHPIQEMNRVHQFISLVESGEREIGPQLGALMHRSHCSYQNMGLDSPGTNLLYNFTLEAESRGIYGGKISGGGSGGTVCILLDKRKQHSAIEYIRQTYLNQRAYDPIVFHSSSNGAHHFGIISLPQKS